MHLQVHVVRESQRLQQTNQRIKANRRGVDPLLSSRGGGYHYWKPKTARDSIEDLGELAQVDGRIHVLLAVRTDKEVAILLQRQPRENVRPRNALTIVSQYLRH